MSKIQITAIIACMVLALLGQLWLMNTSAQLHKESINPKYELVQFDNGNYGIRRPAKYSEGGFEYNDFSALSDRFWWPKNSKYFTKDCQTTELKARERLDELNKPKPNYSHNLSITEHVIN